MRKRFSSENGIEKDGERPGFEHVEADAAEHEQENGGQTRNIRAKILERAPEIVHVGGTLEGSAVRIQPDGLAAEHGERIVWSPAFRRLGVKPPEGGTSNQDALEESFIFFQIENENENVD